MTQPPDQNQTGSAAAPVVLGGHTGHTGHSGTGTRFGGSSDPRARHPLQQSRVLAHLLLAAIMVYINAASNFDFVPKFGKLTIETPDNTIDTLFFLSVLAFALLVLWRNRRVVLRSALSVNPLLLGFMGWMLLSVAWAEAPVHTFKMNVRLYGAFLIVLAVATSLDSHQDTIDAIRFWLWVMVMISIAMVVFLPGLAVTQMPIEHRGNWAGMSGHKNGAAQLGVYASIFCAHGFMTAPQHLRGRRLFMLATSLLLVLGAQSSTGILLAGACVPLVMFLSASSTQGLLRSPWTWMALAGFVVALCYAFVVLLGAPGYADLLGPVAAAFGKDLTLTGRTEIWAIVVEYIAERPITGYAYGGFWRGLEGPSGELARRIEWLPWQSHNGYLDVLVDGGIIGLSLIVGAILLHAVRAIRLFPVSRAMPLHLTLVLAVLVSNISESGISRPNVLNAFLVYYFIVSFGVHRGWALSRMKAAPRAKREPAVIGARSAAGREGAVS